MEVESGLGIISLLPIIIALLLAFITKDAVSSLLIGCVFGVVLADLDTASGLAVLFQNALDTKDFILVMVVEVAVGIMIAFYLLPLTSLTESCLHSFC